MRDSIHRLFIGVTFVCCLTSCTSTHELFGPFKIAPVAGTGQYGVYRHSYLIPEYTETDKGLYVNTHVEAERLLRIRRRGLRPFVHEKYNNPNQYQFLGISKALLLPGLAAVDVLHAGYNLLKNVVHLIPGPFGKGQKPPPVVWFPGSRWALSGFPIDHTGPPIPPVRDEWHASRVKQQALQAFLKSTTDTFYMEFPQPKAPFLKVPNEPTARFNK